MPLWSGNLEMIFVLLTKVIAFHVQITIEKIEVSRLEKSIGIIFSFDKYNWSRRSLVLDSLNISPNELLEKVII